VRTETESKTDDLDLEPQVIFGVGEQCFRCGGLQSSLTEYIEHLQEHKDDTRKCISKLMEKVKAKDHTADWECESCYITLLNDEEKAKLDEETCWNRLNLHQKACMEKVDLEMRKIKQEMNNNNHLPPTSEKMCKLCSRKFKLEIQLKKHKKICPASVLSFLDATGWTECPVCNMPMTTDMLDHLLSHYQIMALLEADTPEADEYRCADLKCQTEKDQLSFPQELRLYFLLHKYKNCKYSFRKNLEFVLDKVPHKDIRSALHNDAIEEISMIADEENLNLNLEAPICVSNNEPEASVENSKESDLTANAEQKCFQCLRVFRNKIDFEDTEEHFCAIVGKLEEPLQETVNSSSSLPATLQCIICNSGTVFSSDLMLRKHVCLAHKGIPILKELKKKGLRDPMSRCFYCTKELTGWEDAVLHTGLDHQKLAHTLKCDPDSKGRELLEMFYPEKYHKWFVKKRKKKRRQSLVDGNIDLVMDITVNTSSLNVADSLVMSKKRKVVVEDNESEVTVKKVRVDTSESAGSDASTPVNIRSSQGKSRSGGSKERLILMCDICPAPSSASYSDHNALRRHLASTHFYHDILKEYPNPAQNFKFKFPCNFPSCDTGFNTELSRVKHLGTVHRQVERCLATPKIYDKAKQNSGANINLKTNIETPWPERKTEALKLIGENVRRVSVDTASPSCKVCGENFPTKESLKLHTCNSIMDKIEQECMEARKRGRSSSTDSSASKELANKLANKQSTVPISNNDDMEKENQPPSDDLGTPTQLQLFLSEDEEEDDKSIIQIDIFRKKVDDACSESDETD